MNQKFQIGARVKITEELDMWDTKLAGSGCSATVLYTHAYVYGSRFNKSYCLDVDGIGEVSWFNENQISLI